MKKCIFFCMFHPTKSWVYFCLILWYPVFGIGSSLTLIATLGLAVAVNMFICWILYCVGIAPESNLSLLLRVLLAVFIMYSAFKALWPSEVINELMTEANITLRQDNQPIIQNFALVEAANILRDRADQLDQNLQAHILRLQVNKTKRNKKKKTKNNKK